MSKAIKDEIKESLNLLGLNFDTSKEQILARTKKLRAVYEDSDTSEDIAKLAEIFNASQTLLVNFELLKSSNDNYNNQNIDLKPKFQKSLTENDVDDRNDSIAESLENGELPESFHSNQALNVHQQLSPEKKKKYILVGSISAILLIVILAIAIPLGIINYKEQKELERETALSDKYYDIESMMMNFQLSNMNTIGEYINDLPYDYRDIITIKNQYQLIMNDVQKIENADLYSDYEQIRVSYYNLVLINNTSYQWDLSGYLESLDARYQILGVYWSGSGYSFKLYVNDTDNSIWLQTSLPNDKSSTKSYYYTHNYGWTEFGYVNQNDSSDEFQAYRIVSISEDSIRIYCYSNETTYTLYS